MSWTFAEERPIYWEEPPEQIAITNVETGEWDAYMLTSKAMRMIRDAKDDENWLSAELHGAEIANKKLRELVRDWYALAVGGANSLADWNHEQADLERRMEELGVEI